MNTETPHRTIIVIGGLSLIVASIAFVLVFAFLAENFDYPKILQGSASDVLPRLHTGGPTMRAVWTVYAFLPFTLIPSAVGIFFACPSNRSSMTLALISASIAALSMSLGLMRWPSIMWALAEVYINESVETKSVIDAIFNGLNIYLGNYIGEFLGEISLAFFCLLTGFSLLNEARYPKWIGWSGVVFSVFFFVGAFRNIESACQVVADVNNILLPLWMVATGASLIRSVKNQPEA